MYVIWVFVTNIRKKLAADGFGAKVWEREFKRLL